MSSLKIAVIGCGIAGMASALYLARAGHSVTLFERFPQPQPVGAGLLLQPSGLAVLNELGLLPGVVAGGAVVRGLLGSNHRGRKVLDLQYQDLGADYYALGIHRARLFDVLHGALRQASVALRLGAVVARITQDDKAAVVVTAKGAEGPFDLVVAADGSHSAVRQSHDHQGRTRTYPWAALWATVPDLQQHFPDRLMQRYRQAQQMVGVLPVGRNAEGVPEVTLFWSLRGDAYTEWRAMGLSDWKVQATALMPEVAPLLGALDSPDQLTFSRYLDVRPRTWVDRRLVYIGDAAHGTSPQLGQGANLALWDAKLLCDSLTEAPVAQALKLYQARRRPALRYYQWASRWLTPCFQSHRLWMPVLRDALAHPLSRLPFCRRYALETMSGLRDGFVRRLPVEPWQIQLAKALPKTSASATRAGDRQRHS